MNSNLQSDFPIDRIQQILDQLTAELAPLESQQPASSFRKIQQNLNELRSTVELLEESLLQTQRYSQELAHAQADAIVRSETIIEELEDTKVRLAVSHQRAEQAALENQLLIDTVFEASNDAILLLQSGKLISGNRRIEWMFDVPLKSLIGDWPFSAITPPVQPNGTESQVLIEDSISLAETTGECRFNLVMNQLAKPGFWCELTLTRFELKGETQILVAIRDISEQKRFEQRLKHQALHDNLTGLGNRAQFRRVIQQAIASHQVTRKPFAIIFLDLDDFKHVNDTMGHSIGDQLLKLVSQRLASQIRSDSLISRFGGDEFAILVSGLNPEKPEVEAITERINSCMQEPFQLADVEVFVGVSLGTTVYPDHGTDVDELLRKADVAMYAAKDQGKNLAKVFDNSMQHEIDLRYRISRDLRIALNEKHLEPYFQPKVCFESLVMCGCESLARWQKTDGTFVPPNLFIPIAENTGLISMISDQIFADSCRAAKTLNDAGVLNGRIAINVSPRQLRDRQVVQHFAKLVENSTANPEWFELEITEHAVMQDVPLAITIFEQLKELGFTIALDDFGTGHSSLSLLQSLSFDTLKIDMSFIQNVPHDAAAVAVARSIISLGKGLGLHLVAEGVETIEQFEFLKHEGCDSVQGYLMAHPMKFDDFLKHTLRSHEIYTAAINKNQSGTRYLKQTIS